MQFGDRLLPNLGLEIVYYTMKLSFLIPFHCHSKLGTFLVYVACAISWIHVIRCIPLPFIHLFSIFGIENLALRFRMFHGFITVYVFASAVIRTTCLYLFATTPGRRLMRSLTDQTQEKLEKLNSETIKRLKTMIIVVTIFVWITIVLNVTGITLSSFHNSLIGSDTAKTNYYFRQVLIAFGVKPPLWIHTLSMIIFQVLTDSSLFFVCVIFSYIIAHTELYRDLRRQIQPYTIDQIDNGSEALVDYFDVAQFRMKYLKLCDLTARLDVMSRVVNCVQLGAMFFTELCCMFVLLWDPPQDVFIYMWVIWFAAASAGLILHTGVPAYLHHSVGFINQTSNQSLTESHMFSSFSSRL